jgi:hypothetical protein
MAVPEAAAGAVPEARDKESDEETLERAVPDATVQDGLTRPEAAISAQALGTG